MRRYIDIITESPVPSEEFMRDFNSHNWPSVSIKMRADDPDEVFLLHIRADVPKQGHGSRAMEKIIELADQYRVNIRLDLPNNSDEAYFGEEDISLEELVDFYTGWGFEFTNDSYMEMIRYAPN